jgi:hypothetical protein
MDYDLLVYYLVYHMACTLLLFPPPREKMLKKGEGDK